MPNITILEDDITSAGSSTTETDVVFVPGFSNTNFNYAIYTTSGEGPSTSTPGTPTTELPTLTNIHELESEQVFPNYACNTVDEITYMCTGITSTGAYTWEQCDNLYISPSPENIATLCSTVAEFNTYFGKDPYVIDAENGNIEGVFGKYAIPAGVKSMYIDGGPDRSYIYAKELLTKGLPVVYYNVCNRSDGYALAKDAEGKDVLTTDGLVQYGTSEQTSEEYKEYFKSDILPVISEKLRTKDETFSEFFEQNATDAGKHEFTMSFCRHGAKTGVVSGDSHTFSYNLSDIGTDEAKNAAKFLGITTTTLKELAVMSNSETVSRLTFTYPAFQGADTGDTNTDWSNLSLPNTSNIQIPVYIHESVCGIASVLSGWIGDQLTIQLTQGTGTDDRNLTVTYTTSANHAEEYYAANKYANGTTSVTFKSTTLTPKDILSKFSSETELSYANVAATLIVNNQKVAPNVKYLYKQLANIYYPINNMEDIDTILDKGEYSIKYITSGGYPTFEVVEETTSTSLQAYGAITAAMIKCANYRGDCVAIIDHANNPERSLSTASTSHSVFSELNRDISSGDPLGVNFADEYRTYATMFTPWASYTCSTLNSDKFVQVQQMPASFAYLTALADSIRTNANWLAVAGVNRGLPPTIRTLNTIKKLTNTIADNYQPRDATALNAITAVKPYGLTIWGNRTLLKNSKGNLTASSFLNIRNMVSEIKKVAYDTAKGLIYEQDSDVTWNKFKIGVSDLLSRMVTGYGISGYQVIRSSTKYNGDALGKAEIAAVIKIYPIYAIEDFEITVVMADDDVSVSG